MVFYVPQVYVCQTCKMEIAHSKSVQGSPLVDEDGKPFCPACLIKFLGQHVPRMESTGKRLITTRRKHDSR